MNQPAVEAEVAPVAAADSDLLRVIRSGDTEARARLYERHAAAARAMAAPSPGAAPASAVPAALPRTVVVQPGRQSSAATGPAGVAPATEPPLISGAFWYRAHSQWTSGRHNPARLNWPRRVGGSEQACDILTVGRRFVHCGPIRHHDRFHLSRRVLGIV